MQLRKAKGPPQAKDESEEPQSIASQCSNTFAKKGKKHWTLNCSPKVGHQSGLWGAIRTRCFFVFGNGLYCMDLFVVTLASLLAGFVDAIVGGGGLVLMPALFATFPGAAPATLFGTNKGASVWGTGLATWQYSRKVALPWRALAGAAVAALVAALAGAWVVTQISPQYLRQALPVLLLLLLAYTLSKKDLGRTHAPRFKGRLETAVLCAIGAAIGFYDGFFGPGTGSFFVFLLVRVAGYDFLNASASAKLLNTASNLAALMLFSLTDHVWWHFVLAMALANMVGSLAGTHLALKHGTGFVRVGFMVVVSALILKTAWDAFLR
jgi:hypothetical protein